MERIRVTPHEILSAGKFEKLADTLIMNGEA